MPTPKQFSITGSVQGMVEWIRKNREKRAAKLGNFSMPEFIEALSQAVSDKGKKTRPRKQTIKITWGEKPYQPNGEPTYMDRNPKKRKTSDFHRDGR